MAHPVIVDRAAALDLATPDPVALAAGNELLPGLLASDDRPGVALARLVARRPGDPDLHRRRLAVAVAAGDGEAAFAALADRLIALRDESTEVRAVELAHARSVLPDEWAAFLSAHLADGLAPGEPVPGPAGLLATGRTTHLEPLVDGGDAAAVGGSTQAGAMTTIASAASSGAASVAERTPTTDALLSGSLVVDETVDDLEGAARAEDPTRADTTVDRDADQAGGSTAPRGARRPAALVAVAAVAVLVVALAVIMLRPKDNSPSAGSPPVTAGSPSITSASVPSSVTSVTSALTTPTTAVPTTAAPTTATPTTARPALDATGAERAGTDGVARLLGLLGDPDGPAPVTVAASPAATQANDLAARVRAGDTRLSLVGLDVTVDGSAALAPDGSSATVPVVVVWTSGQRRAGGVTETLPGGRLRAVAVVGTGPDGQPALVAVRDVSPA